jgi:predicted NAD/FAD-binding protein
MKIGIVGSGIAGLSAAWLLSRKGHEVVLYEKQSRVGVDSHSVVCRDGDESFFVDVPSRLLNGALWPALLELFESTGIETIPVDSTQGFAQGNSKPYFNFCFEDLHAVLPKLLLNSESRKIVADISRLRKQGSRDLTNGLSPDLTFGEYIDQAGYSSEFTFGFLYPVLSSTVCTCSSAAIENYPAVILLEALFRLTSKRKSNDAWLLRSRHGTQDIANRLSADCSHVTTNVNVDSVSSHEKHVRVSSSFTKDDGSIEEYFDHVIIAVQANHAMRMLAQPSNLEIEMLTSFGYEDVEIVLHFDKNLLPSDKNTWSTFNFATNDQPKDCRHAACSIWLNRFYNRGKSETDLFQTINPLYSPAREKTLCRRILQRPVVTRNSFKGWRLIDELNRQPDRRIWFAGSYASYGVPLLETGLLSARKVVEEIGQRSQTFDPGLITLR